MLAVTYLASRLATRTLAAPPAAGTTATAMTVSFCSAMGSTE